MTRRTTTLVVTLLLPAAVACAQNIRTGGLENLALDAQVQAGSSASAADGKYAPLRAIDGDTDSRWATAANAEPPQWLELTFAEPVTIDTIVLEQSSLQDLYANARQVELSFSEGDPVTVELEDTWAGQIIRFEPHETAILRLTILSAYELKTYLGIDELRLFNDANEVVKAVIPPRRRWEHPDLTAHGRETHPCVNKTPADVERARENIERYPFLAQYVEGMQAQADEWLERSDEWILEMVPEPGAAFAYGFTGCPIRRIGSRAGSPRACSYASRRFSACISSSPRSSPG